MVVGVSPCRHDTVASTNRRKENVDKRFHERRAEFDFHFHSLKVAKFVELRNSTNERTINELRRTEGTKEGTKERRKKEGRKVQQPPSPASVSE